MARKEQAGELLRKGLPPSEIAQQMGTSTAAVMHYLLLQIGEGDLKRSDLAFSLPREVRGMIEEIIGTTKSAKTGAVSRELAKRGLKISKFDVGVYLQYRRSRVVLGDMYELIRSLEVRLHTFVKQAFVREFGEEQWWRSGVPDTIRAECAALLEKDPEPAEEPYCYTHVISLREILDKKWSILSKYMPQHVLNQKKDLLDRLLRLNRVRNSVMHPVRKTVLSQEDFEFVRELNADLLDFEVQENISETHESETAKEEAAEAVPIELVSRLTPIPERKVMPETATTADESDLVPTARPA